VRVAACVMAALVLGGCATHRPPAGADPVALETYIEQVRQASLAARPARPNAAATLERTDSELAAARLALAFAPTPANHRRVAIAYARLGVGDTAYDNFMAAIRLDPHDAGSFDGLARVWRDWGFPQRGLTDVYRAIYFAPDAAGPRNTLGTLLLRMGLYGAARAAFERTLLLDPGAPYALNNLCYVSLLEGDGARAIDRCRAAVHADPHLTTAHNNLALAYAASGDFAAASHEFLVSGDAAAERYNMGIALLATGHGIEAAAAFDEAAALHPSLTLARDRARQARQLAAAKPPSAISDQHQ